MRALQVNASLPRLGLQVVDVRVPILRKNEILIRVCAAGVTPSELLWYPTSHRPDGTPRMHAIPGHEFSGAVAAPGEGVEQIRAGDLVYGMNDWFIEGATAEYCLATACTIAHKPVRLTHAEAATIPSAH
jgi:NADPH:quinone reductase-like Zn-dependent oxidoreductase